MAPCFPVKASGNTSKCSLYSNLALTIIFFFKDREFYQLGMPYNLIFSPLSPPDSKPLGKEFYSG